MDKMVENVPSGLSPRRQHDRVDQYALVNNWHVPLQLVQVIAQVKLVVKLELDPFDVFREGSDDRVLRRSRHQRLRIHPGTAWFAIKEGSYDYIVDIINCVSRHVDGYISDSMKLYKRCIPNLNPLDTMDNICEKGRFPVSESCVTISTSETVLNSGMRSWKKILSE
jgi:hypothetical protein